MCPLGGRNTSLFMQASKPFDGFCHGPRGVFLRIYSIFASSLWRILEPSEEILQMELSLTAHILLRTEPIPCAFPTLNPCTPSSWMNYRLSDEPSPTAPRCSRSLTAITRVSFRHSCRCGGRTGLALSLLVPWMIPVGHGNLHRPRCRPSCKL